MKTSYGTIPAYITKDASEIRELMHPAVHGNARQSLAEAIIQPGEKTQLHRHQVTEELYHVTQGFGMMRLGENCFAVAVGDTVLIAPGVAHCVQATGESPLHILCCCSPAYSHDDTELL
ncbi:cupin domain-containing protein [Propionivibrio sp.]|uniref:cupin domain-containing protein n=1 Tax=Propionivibrio sp. TaxID=2212460 RepID=UPI003BF309EB